MPTCTVAPSGTSAATLSPIADREDDKLNVEDNLEEFAPIAEAELAHFGREASLVREDARTTRQSADCIVSNLPYGLYCHLAREAMQAVLLMRLLLLLLVTAALT